MRTQPSLFPTDHTRHGISLLEVLISIGVIALGIFGVAALIPVAQFMVQQGVDADRQATAGQRAVAEFRIRNMGSPGTPDNLRWRTVALEDLDQIFRADGQVLQRGFCLDPLGVANAIVSGEHPAWYKTFPAQRAHLPFDSVRDCEPRYMLMPRITLTNGITNHPLNIAMANEIFLLPDELVFQRPSDEKQPPNRQFFVNPQTQTPTKTFAEGSMSWLATITPTAVANRPSDQYLLSIVILKDRIPQPQLAAAEEGLACVESPFAGEIIMNDSPVPSSGDGRMRVADLRVGDWLLLAKQVRGPGGENLAVYRWTKILGADERDGQIGVPRTFTIATDDFFRSTELNVNPRLDAHAVFMRGVVAVYEKTIRLENSTVWD